MYNMMTIANGMILYFKVAQRVDLKRCHRKEKMVTVR